MAENPPVPLRGKFGRPIVATVVPGCREIVRTGVNALLVPPDAPRALAEPIAARRGGGLKKRRHYREGTFLLQHGRKIAVIGLGYVGLPVAVAFARARASVIGFDIDSSRIDELRACKDRTREVEAADLGQETLTFTSDAGVLSGADFFIVTVPTPIDEARRPDLRPLRSASATVARVLKRGDIVVYESTVYPGCVEEDCAPLLEKGSGLKAGSDFTVGYSPERINPGDNLHRFETITKVVAGQDERTLEIVANVYGSVVTAGIHRAPSIKVAEAAKVIENTQRDLNIAFMNELSAICHQLKIDTGDVLAAAGTKWNFIKFYPGLVGGHCIGVDPYYLTHKAEQSGYHPEVILCGRRINDGVGARIAAECVRGLFRNKRTSANVTVLGLTFKENVPDTRNSKVVDIIRELKDSGVEVQVCDPLAIPDEVEHEYGLSLVPYGKLRPSDAVILAVAHDEYVKDGWALMKRILKDGKGLVFDVKSVLDRKSLPAGIELWRL